MTYTAEVITPYRSDGVNSRDEFAAVCFVLFDVPGEHEAASGESFAI